MLKKTTIYLSDDEIGLLKKKATIHHKTVAEVIRLSIRQTCQPQTKEEQKLWDSLEKVWAQTDKIDSAIIEAAVENAVNEGRSGNKKTRRNA